MMGVWRVGYSNNSVCMHALKFVCILEVFETNKKKCLLFSESCITRLWMLRPSHNQGELSAVKFFATCYDYQSTKVDKGEKL